MHFIVYFFKFTATFEYKVRYLITQIVKLFLYIIGKGIASDYFFGTGKYVITNKFGTFEIEEPSDMHAIVGECFESSLTSYFTLKQGKIFFDIGANIGKYSIYIANQGNIVYAFEPNVSTYNYLQKNISLNHGQIFAQNVGLSDHEGKLILYYPEGNFGVARFENIWEKSHYKVHQATVKLLSFSEFVVQNNISIDAIGLIKIDVEGAELSVLKGMIEILNDMDCRFIIEIVKDYEEINMIFENAGYELLYSDGHSNYVFDKK